jgi:hypothetical protein
VLDIDTGAARRGWQRRGHQGRQRLQPRVDAAGVAAELSGQPAVAATCANQFDHLLTKRRRIRWFGVGISDSLLSEKVPAKSGELHGPPTAAGKRRCI